MKTTFHEQALEDVAYWIVTGNTRALKRIMLLIKDIQRAPNDPGLGKAERLKNQFSGYSSRRITEIDRLVYRVEGDELVIIQARGHY